MTNRLLLHIFALLLVSHQAVADDGIKWGQPVNGLRIGIESPVTSITSDQSPAFKITAQNVSSQPITIPTPDTFLLKTNPDSEDYHELPLIPIVQEIDSQPVSPALPYRQNGKPLKEAVSHTLTLAIGQSVTWSAIQACGLRRCTLARNRGGRRRGVPR